MYHTDELNTFHVLDDLELEQCVPSNTLAVLDSYWDGYKTGLTWTDWWIPGGPSVHTGRNKELAKQTQAQADAWKDGWKYGMRDAGRPMPSGIRPPGKHF